MLTAGPAGPAGPARPAARRWARGRSSAARLPTTVDGTPADGSADAGTVTLLIVVYTLIALALLFVVIDVADLFLAQRSASNLADGAALAAAQAVDRAAYYAGADPRCRLPLDAAGAAAAADQYLRDADLPRGWSDVTGPRTSVDAATGTVTVTITHRVHLPLQGVLGAVNPGWSGGVPVSVTAHARAPFVAAAAPAAPVAC
jgi:uncharacterized membrane protein